MRDWNGIVSRIDGLVPRRWKNKVRIIARDIAKLLAEFLRGQLMVMGVLAAFYALALWALGLNNGVSIALLAFGQLFGFVGVLLALPVSAALLVGLRHLRAAYVASPLYRDH